MSVSELLDILGERLVDHCQVSLRNAFDFRSFCLLFLSLVKLLVAKLDSVFELQLEGFVIELIVFFLLARFFKLCLCISQQITEGFNDTSALRLVRSRVRGTSLLS